MIILTLSRCRGHLGHRVIGPSGHRIIGRSKTCAPGRVHQEQKDSEPKRNCLAVWSEATIIVPNFAARPTRAPGRVHQAQKDSEPKRNCLAVWSEATIIVPNFAARPTRAPGRVHQAQKAVLRKMTQWRFGAGRPKNWRRGPESHPRGKSLQNAPRPLWIRASIGTKLLSFYRLNP